MLNKSMLLGIRSSVEGVLRNNILDFWMKHTVDYEYGGFLGQVRQNGSPTPRSKKGAILHARILWAFSASYHALKQEEYLQFAKKAFDYLYHSFLDKKYGGLYCLLDYRGEPVDQSKKMDCQAYAIYALCEYYRVTGDYTALKMAQEIYEKVETHSRDVVNGGYWSELPRDWNSFELVTVLKKDKNRRKTFNTHLHLMEAYTRLYQETISIDVKNSLKDLIRLIADRFYQPDEASFNLILDEKWNRISKIKIYGMDIEGSWLLHEAAESLGEIEVEKRAVGILMDTSKNIQTAMDQDGGLFYEGIGVKIINFEKHWWPQTEAAVGLLHAYQMSGEEGFLKAAFKVWEFIETKLVDRKNGEWFHHISPSGKINLKEPKTGIWKCPYHNTRACLETMKILRLIADQQGTEVKKTIDV